MAPFFTSIEEYERWRNTLIDAKNSKKGRRIKYRDIPELDIYFFKLKIPLPILNTYNSFYLAFLRDYLNSKVNPDYGDKYYTDTAIDFNVLKSYDNKLITLSTNKLANSINYLNTDIDIRYGINIFTLTFPLYHKGNISNYNFKIYDFNVLNSTAFIPGGSTNSEWGDLILPPNCKYSGRWIPTFNDIGCAIQNAGIKMLNWMLTASQVITILRPLAIIAKATVNFLTAIFPVFKTVSAFYYTFQFLIGFAGRIKFC